MTYFGVGASGSFIHSTADEGLWGQAPIGGDVQGLKSSTFVAALRNTVINSAAPVDGQALVFDGTEYIPSGIPLPGGTTHAFLSATHTDVVGGPPVRGGIVRANTTPAWEQLALGTAEFVLFSDGNDANYTRLGAPTPFSLGVVATPSMTFTGDLDTGLSAAAADVLIASAGASGIVKFDGIQLRTVLIGGIVEGNTLEGVNTTLAASDNVTFATAAPLTITLPPSPVKGERHVVKDSGGNATNSLRITIAGNGNNIDGNTNIEIRNAYGSFTIVFNGTQWNVI